MSHRVPPSLDEADGRHPIEAPRWFIVAVVGGREKAALHGCDEVLKPRNLRAYLPCEKRWIRVVGRRIKIDRALLPGYLFAELTSAEFHLLRDIDGVRGLMCGTTSTGRSPVAAPGAFIEQLAFAQAMGAFDHTSPTGRVFQPAEGDRVNVTGGQFQGLVGKIAAAKPGARRVKVMLEACGLFGAGAMELDVGLLAAA